MEVEWKLDSAERSPVRVNPVLAHPEERRISLDGTWRFRLDPEDEGLRRRWFQRPDLLRHKITVPGCWQGQGFGHDGQDEVRDFRLRVRVFRATYTGTGWYGKQFRVPAAWKGSSIWINFGGVHPSADIWLNGQKLGFHSGPFVPFAFDATAKIRWGGENFLAVRVHEANRWLGFTYNWQGNWSGLFRSVELSATGSSWIEELRACPDVDAQKLRMGILVSGADTPLTLMISVRLPNGRRVAAHTAAVRGGERSFDIAVPSPRLWSPDAPNLYHVDAVLTDNTGVLDAVSERVGFVKLSMRGKHFLINDEPYYMRGSGDFVANPETGSPDTDRDRWRRKLKTLRDYGYNHVRCQSYVPTPEYYDAADEVGLIVQGEMGMLGAWGGQSIWHKYGWPPPLPTYRRALRDQWNRTVMRDVNHPSATMYCMSNELGQSTDFPRTAWQCYRDTKAIKPSALVIWTDGGCNESLPGDFVNAEARYDRQASLPVIQHEYRWWSAYPDIRARKKFKGAIRPCAVEYAERVAQAGGMAHLLPVMARNSQRLQYIEARGKMEGCRRDNPRLAGISHFNAMDIGLSPQGIVDEFYERKYAHACTWRRTNGDTVVLMDRDFDAHVLAGGEAFRCTLLVSDFSHPPLQRPMLEWRLVAGRRTLAKGKFRFKHKPFRTCKAGHIHFRLPDVAKPVKASLRAVLREGKRTFSNEWNFCLFPRDVMQPASAAIYGSCKHTWLTGLRGVARVRAGHVPESASDIVLLTERFDEVLAGFVKGGGRAVLAAPEGLVRPFRPKLGLEVGRYFFLPPANYPPYESGHTGTIIAEHPMLGAFPHEGFADLQFYRLIAEAPPLDLDALGAGRVEPVIRAIGTFQTCRPLAYLAEFKLGKGALVISALDLNQKLPEARYLLAAILKHASSRAFKPQAGLAARGLDLIIEAGRLG